MKISTHSASELGYSHIKENKVCQDYSLDYSAPDGSLFIAIVSDGHGGKTYCRSDKGSKYACEIAMEAIKRISKEPVLLEGILGNSAQVPVRKKDSKANTDSTSQKFEDVYPKIKDVDPVFEQLFLYIYSQWLQKIEIDWKENPPTKEELQLLGNNEAVKAYGATLLSFVRTQNFWFGFHIGDGKCLVCDERGKWYEPILWDADCFLNQTTSLCQNEAYKKFRYSFSGKGDFPSAVMLGTDGIDDSWGDRLPAYYTSILEDIMTEGIEKAKESLKNSLPNLTENGSGDDVSVAWIVDEDAIAVVLPKLKLEDEKKEYELIAAQKKNADELLKQKIETAEKEIKLYQTQIQQLEQKKSDLNKDKEELNNNILLLENEIGELSKSLEDANSKVQTLVTEVDKLSKSLEKSNVESKVKKKKNRIVIGIVFSLLIGILLGVGANTAVTKLLNESKPKIVNPGKEQNILNDTVPQKGTETIDSIK